MEKFHSYNESNWIEWKERILGWEWGLIDLFWLLFLHYHDDDPKMFGFLSRKKIFDFQQLSENKKWMGKKGCSWETSTWKNSMHNWWMIRNCESKSVWARCVVKMWKMRRSTKVQAHTHTHTFPTSIAYTLHGGWCCSNRHLNLFWTYNNYRR